MKKIFSFLIVLLIISAGNNIFSQKLSGNCPQKDLTREFCKTGDSLARFMDNIKKTTSADAWALFVEDAALGPVAAFNHFGERSTELRETFNELGNKLDGNTRSLISAINPDGSLTGEQVKNSIISGIICYYDDTNENDLKKLIQDGGGPVLERLDGGPCDPALRSCMSGAASAHTSQLINCGFGSGGIWKWLGGWWGAGAGLACLIGVEITYNHARGVCIINYCQCANCDN